MEQEGLYLLETIQNELDYFLEEYEEYSHDKEIKIRFKKMFILERYRIYLQNIRCIYHTEDMNSFKLISCMCTALKDFPIFNGPTTDSINADFISTVALKLCEKPVKFDYYEDRIPMEEISIDKIENEYPALLDRYRSVLFNKFNSQRVTPLSLQDDLDMFYTQSKNFLSQYKLKK